MLPNLSEIDNLTPIYKLDAWHKICYYVPLDVTIPLVFTLLYALIMDLDIPAKIFGEFETEKTIRGRILRAFFTEESFRGMLILVNGLCLMIYVLIPMFVI